MRLAVCALSAVLLSGCSWLGMGGSGSAGGAYGVNCAPSGTGYYSGGDACGVGGGYGVAGNGYGAGYGAGAGSSYGAGASYGAGYGAAGYGAGYGTGAGYGAAGYGASAGYGAGAAGYGAGGYGAGIGGLGTGALGAGALGAGLAANGVGGLNGYNLQGFQGAYGASGGVTTLGANAAYGSAIYGQNVVGTQYANGQYVQGAGVQTVQGAPYYVPQPYPAYYGVPQLRGVGAALPFGIEAGIGTDFNLNGDLLAAKVAGPASDTNGNPVTGTGARLVSAQPSVSYGDAFDNAINYDLAATYDLDRNTTVLGRVGYSQADGQDVALGTASEGAVTDAPITASFTDLEQYTVEAGVRRYLGNPSALRPYVGANAGFIYSDDVYVTQSSAAFAGGPETQQFIDGGWSPTAAGVVGAEYAVGSRAAIGVETGIRWSDNLDTITASEDRWSIPVKLRGRVAF